MLLSTEPHTLDGRDVVWVLKECPPPAVAADHTHAHKFHRAFAIVLVAHQSEGRLDRELTQVREGEQARSPLRCSRPSQKLIVLSIVDAKAKSF